MADATHGVEHRLAVFDIRLVASGAKGWDYCCGGNCKETAKPGHLTAAPEARGPASDLWRSVAKTPVCPMWLAPDTRAILLRLKILGFIAGNRGVHCHEKAISAVAFVVARSSLLPGQRIRCRGGGSGQGDALV